MPAAAEQKHHVPGRLRLRVPSAKGNRAQLDLIREQLAAAPGVHNIELNPATAAVVVRYDPALYADFPSRLSQFASENDVFTLRMPDELPERSVTDTALETVFGRASRAVQSGTGNAINLKQILPFGIAAYAFIFVDHALAAAQWLSWMQFAWSAYFELHQDEPVHDVGRQVEALRSDIAGLRGLLERGNAG